MSIFKLEIAHFVAYDNEKQLKLCIQVTHVNDNLMSALFARNISITLQIIDDF